MPVFDVSGTGGFALAPSGLAFQIRFLFGLVWFLLDFWLSELLLCKHRS